MHIFDPCSAHGKADAMKAVRRLVCKAGIASDNTDLPLRGDTKALCCGFGGHIYPANPGLRADITENRVAISDLPYISYCANCNALFRATGKESVHMIELLLPSKTHGLAENSNSIAETPLLCEARATRETLRARLLGDFWGERDACKEPTMNYDIYISHEIKSKADKLLIPIEDILHTVSRSETDLCGILDEDSGYISASSTTGAVTLWVSYSKDDSGHISIQNIYSHRMHIEGGES
jgi:hypothetical protein